MSRVIIYGFFLTLALAIVIFAYIVFREITESQEIVTNSPSAPVLMQTEEQDVSRVDSNSDQNIYYFGYGSNMNKITMQGRCGQDNYTDLGQGLLVDYQLYFFIRGYANIKAIAGQSVRGVLYQINDSCLASLDKAEGYPTFYQRQEVKIIYGDKKINAEVYIVKNDDTTGLPSDTYYQTVLTGAEEHNLPAEYIKYIKIIAGRLEGA